MNIEKHISEGYYNPTSFDALTNVAKAEKQSAFRPLVYICSPFSGDTEYNSNQARKYSRFAYEQNTIPVTPHLLYPQMLNDNNPGERALGTSFGMALLSGCQEAWVFGGHITKGMGAELDECKKLHIPIRYVKEEDYADFSTRRC